MVRLYFGVNWSYKNLWTMHDLPTFAAPITTMRRCSLKLLSGYFGSVLLWRRNSAAKNGDRGGERFRVWRICKSSLAIRSIAVLCCAGVDAVMRVCVRVCLSVCSAIWARLKWKRKKKMKMHGKCVVCDVWTDTNALWALIVIWNSRFTDGEWITIKICYSRRLSYAD